jgi:hypothetical protein
MTDYRAYTVWPDGNYEGFEALSCIDDDEAIDEARRLAEKGAIELWTGERFITRMEHGIEGRTRADPADAVVAVKTAAPPHWSRFIRGIVSLYTQGKRNRD